jgi:hypothetical protein
MKRTPMIRALVLSATLPAFGCSFVVMRPPPAPTSSGEPVQCTSSPAAPLLDTAAAMGLGLASLAYWSLTTSLCRWNESPDKSCPMDPAAAGGLLAAGAYVVSAGYGFHQSTDCHKAKRAGVQRCDPATGMGCGPLGLPPGTAPRAP